MNDTSAASLVRPRQRSAFHRGWPSVVLAALVAAAAIYSFSPRPDPAFAPTQVYPDRILVNGLARSAGGRYAAVGEQGQILIADEPAGPWRSAVVTPQRGSTLTQLRFIDENVALAVGHDGWIIRSADGGRTWTEVAFAESGDPLLGLAGPYDGRLFAFGGFGLYMTSDDQGQTWQRGELVEEAPADSGGEDEDPFAAAGDEDFDPFASFDAGEMMGARHINAMTRAADGSLIVVGERGLLMRSTHRGDSWQPIEDVYAGSFFGVLTLPSGTLIAYGMRGNVFRSEDAGVSWQHSTASGNSSLFGGAIDAKGRPVLVGAANSVLVSGDDGRSFRDAAPDGRATLAAVVPLPDGGWLIGGEDGIAVIEPAGEGA